MATSSPDKRGEHRARPRIFTALIGRVHTIELRRALSDIPRCSGTRATTRGPFWEGWRHMTYGARLDSPSFHIPRKNRLAIRLIARDGRATVIRRTLLPVIGADDIILPGFDDTLGSFAMRAQEGDTDARDALFFAYLPKLERLMGHARPPYAPNGMTGIWDRDDVEQEAWLVFVELVEAWSGDVSFTSWLLSRFPWRLKDVIRDGIGRPSIPPRRRVVDMELAEMVSTPFEEMLPETSELVDRIVAALPDELAEALIGHTVHGKTKAQVATEMGVSRRTMVRYWQEIRRIAAEVLDGEA